MADRFGRSFSLLCGLQMLAVAACGTGPDRASVTSDREPEETGSLEEALSHGNHGFAWVTLNTATSTWVVQNNFSYASGSTPFPTVSHPGAGLYVVTFAGLSPAYTGPGYGGNVQVVATNQAGTGSLYNSTRCKVTGWNVPPTQSVSVACHDTAGNLADSPFIVHYVQARSASLGESGYVWTSGDPTSGIAYNPSSQWSGNTAGGLNTVQRTGQGAYNVTFGGLAAPFSAACAIYPPCYAGNAQVTAYDFTGFVTAGYCKLRGWVPVGADEVVTVQCYDGSGNPADSRFSINFDHRPSSPSGIGAHAFANNLGAASYAPDPAYSYNSDAAGFGTGTNLALRQVKGVYQMRHFGLQNNKAAPHVTAVGLDNRHCKIEKWGLIPGLGTDVQIETRCWNPTGGAPQDSLYAEVFVSRRKPVPPDADGDGYSVQEGDCNDANASVNPGAAETCNAVDDDCDGSLDDVACLSAGANHTCAVVQGGRVKCWGRNFEGQLGVGDIFPRGAGAGEMGANLPFVSLGTGRTATAIAAGGTHTCALLDNGQVKCWGANNFGQLGQGDTVVRGDEPGEMGDNLSAVNLGVGQTVTAIAASSYNTCALFANSRIKCWGYNFNGQLGLGDGGNRGVNGFEMGDNLPFVDLGAGRTAKAISLGGAHSCALLDNDRVKCWGYNAGGQLGLGDSGDRGDAPGEMGDNLPPIELGAGRTVTVVAGGGNHTCARLDNAAIKCWGANHAGQLGLGDTLLRGINPTQMGDNLPAIGLSRGFIPTAIAAGGQFSCALSSGQVKCWGSNNAGELGQGDTVVRGDAPGELDALPAISLGSASTVAFIESGVEHSCALLNGGQLKCWGSNYFGELGLGDLAHRGDGPGEMGDALPPVDL